MRTQFALQIKKNDSCWIPGIRRYKTKKQAIHMANGINKTGGIAVIVKLTDDGWKEI